MANRRVLRDDQWQQIEHLLPGKATDRGVTAKDNGLFLEAVLWIGRTGAPWRDLPAELGNWHTRFTRFARWAKTGVWECVFRAVSGDPDLEEVMIDSTVIRAHQHAASAQKNRAHRLWAVLKADSAPKSMASSIPSAIRSASRSPVPSKPTSVKPLPGSIRLPKLRR
jgi:putative transposase